MFGFFSINFSVFLQNNIQFISFIIIIFYPIIYLYQTTTGEDLSDFVKLMRNKFKSRRYRSRPPKKLGYLPVQTIMEGSTIETYVLLTFFICGGVYSLSRNYQIYTDDLHTDFDVLQYHESFWPVTSALQSVRDVKHWKLRHYMRSVMERKILKYLCINYLIFSFNLFLSGQLFQWRQNFHITSHTLQGRN